MSGEPDQTQSQFAILKSRSFLPLFVTQAISAFNDNAVRNGIAILITYDLAVRFHFDAALFVQAGLALFMLPYFLFSAIAGQLADKYDKAKVARWVKLFDLVAMVFGGLSLYLENPYMHLTVLFLAGTTAAFFGPIKYGVLPQYLKREELIAIMAKTDKAEKARDESRTELEKLKVESSKLKELFQNEWNDVVEKSLKEQNETTISLMEKDKIDAAVKLVSVKEDTISITKSGKKDKNAKNSSERKGDVTSKTPGQYVDPEANSYANKLRSTVARAAWSVARDTGSIHVSMQKVQQYEEALATVKEAIGMNGSL